MPTLYIASTDIGNRDDNTLRVIEKIKNADFIFVESLKEGSKLLKHFNIKKEMIELSEHTKDKEILEFIKKIKSSDTAVLISDCGTPLIEDPGLILTKACFDNNIKVLSLPGVSSITAAIMSVPFSMKEFYYAGLLPRKNTEREKKLKYLKNLKVPIIILDTPYRFSQVIDSINKVFLSERDIAVCFDLTSENEEIIINKAEYILKNTENTKKREFIIIINS